jgi:hypothetical protein
MNSEILNLIDGKLKAYQFKKKGLTWRLDGAECILIFNLQRSYYGEMYYVNLGVWIKALGAKRDPRHDGNHFYGRIEYLMEGMTNLEKCLNFETCEKTFRGRKMGISIALKKALPVFLKWRTVLGLKKWAVRQKVLVWATTPGSRKLLGVAY